MKDFVKELPGGEQANQEFLKAQKLTVRVITVLKQEVISVQQDRT